MGVGQLSESDAVDALRLPFYSSSHPTGSHGWRNQFDLGNPDSRVLSPTNLPLPLIKVIYGVRLSRSLGQYQIHLPSDVWIDLEAGVSAIDRAEAALRAGEPERVLGPATVAATVAKRSFLPSVNGFWVDSQRRRLERQLIRALDCLSEMRIGSRPVKWCKSASSC